ncbi:MAG: PIN domain-containing protein [Hyphomicrobiaceae bacterium]|nr:PIN domain-containing protein [Hyphomicrobiaceae bacterium]
MSDFKPFFDTNILVYLTAGDPARSSAARALLTAGGTVSVQVLNEFTSVARRKLGFSWDEVREFIGTICSNNEVVPITLETHVRGRELAGQYQLNIFDGVIIAAAQFADCTILYSEDMHDGLAIDGLTIRNPFAPH